MSDHKSDSLGNRMKSYENCFRTQLPIRMPVVLRIDGKAFHSYTKGCKRPYDPALVECMNDTAMYLCKNVQGCQLAYVQSDEISLLLVNYQSRDTQSWFDNNLQKIISVSASMAGSIFTANSWKIWRPVNDNYPMGEDALDRVKPAFFDSRGWVLPKEEVCNYFIWRQQDATRNSVQMLARTLYSHSQCEDKNNSELQEMCFQKGVNWNDALTAQKRGRCIVKTKSQKQGLNPKTGVLIDAERTEWIVDNEIPIFSQDRAYVERYVYPLVSFGHEEMES
jgi:tRNA(His) guanylyltransferase